MELVIKLTRIKTYDCNECTEIFISKDKIKRHTKLHKQQSLRAFTSPKSASFKCKECKSWFPTSRECALHENSHHSPKEHNSNEAGTLIKCEYCCLKFDSESTFKVHWLRHQQFPHTCNCGNGYHLLSDLQTHMTFAHPVKEETIDTSYEGFNTPGFLDAIHETPESKLKLDSAEESNKNRAKFDKIKSDVGKKTAPLPKKGKPKRKKNKSKQNIKKGPYRFMSINKDKSVSCLKCDATFKKDYTYRSHYYKQHDRIFVCPKCDKSFGDKGNLKIHMASHLDESDRPYSCTICERRFTQTGAVKLHYKRFHARIKDHICRYCQKGFTERAKKIIHERIHTGDKPYACNYCGKRFSDPSALRRHIRTHTGDKIYACPECPMRFSDASGLIAHKLRHVGIKKHKCHICDKAFLQVNSLKTHLINVHIGMKKFECHYCGQKFGVKVTLQSHIQSIHHKELGITKRYICDYCNIMITSKKNLVTHISHKHGKYLGLKEQVYECYYCGVKHKFKINVRNHIYSVHGKEFGKPLKKVQCHVCKKIYTQNTLGQHIRLRHEPLVLCECDYCGKKCRLKKSLEAHIYRAHRKVAGFKEDMYKCDQCKNYFNSPENLEEHIRFKHKTALYCNVCKARYYSERGLNNHKKYFCNVIKKKVLCQYCGESFKYIKRHIQNVHENSSNKQYECHYCRNSYKEKSSIKLHIYLRHRKEAGLKVKALKCPHCKKIYRTKGRLKHHVNISHNVFIYCDMCPNSFRTQKGLKTHKMKRCNGYKLKNQIRVEEQ